MATYANGITGFSADEFTINASDFANSPGNGTFAIGRSGTSLTVTFTPVPEPSLILAVAASAGGAWLRRRQARITARR